MGEGLVPEHVDFQSSHQTNHLRLTSQATDGEAQVRGVRGELTEGRIDRYPIAEKNFRPGVVVELAVDVGEARIDSGWNARRAREGDEQLGVLVTIAGTRAQYLERARNPKGDALG